MTIKRQLILFFAPLIAIISIMLIAYTQYQSYQDAIESGRTTALSIAADQSSAIQRKVTLVAGYISGVNALIAESLAKDNPTREKLVEIIQAAAVSKRNFFGIGMVFPEFDKENNKKYVNTSLGNAQGVFVPYLSFPNGKDLVIGQSNGYLKGTYFASYSTGKKVITAPYRGASSGLLMVTMAEPIRVRGKIVGIVFVDLSLEDLSDIIKNIEVPYKGGYACVVSNDGTIIAHPNPKEQLRNIKDFSFVDKAKIAQELADNKVIKEKGVEADGTEMITTLYPFTVLEGAAPWYFGLLLQKGEVMREFTISLYKTLAISVAGVIIALGLTIFVASNISKSVQRITKFSVEIAEGNYDASVEAKGFTSELVSLKNSLANMVESLLKTMGEANQSKQLAEEGLRKAEVAMAEAEEAKVKAEESQKEMLVAAENIESVSTRLSTAAEQLSAQVEESSRSAEQQREQVGISVSAMEQMNSTVLDVAQNASKASEGSDVTKQSAEEGAEIVKESISSIKEVEKNVSVLQEEMEGLGKQAEAIGTIMTVISDIADQTNLLALNAAIEAARAGDAGRGFAVVADEVRKLAEKTMDATGEVGQSITGIQQGMTRSISALGVTATNISKSTDLVAKSGDALAGIVDEAITSAEQISSIAAAVEEQSASCQSINDSLLDINRISDEVATVMNESSQAVMDLSRQASELEKLVTHLRKE